MKTSDSSAVETPADASSPGWMARTSAAVIAQLLQWRLVRAALRYSGRRGPLLADAVTYRALFSVFAGVLLGFSLAALWLSQNDAAWDAVVSAVSSAVPGLIGTGDSPGIVDLDRIPELPGLSIAGAISLLGLIGSALGAIGSLRQAVRTIAATEAADGAWYLVMGRNVLLALIIGSTFLGAAALTFTGELLVKGAAGLLDVDADSAAVRWMVRGLSLLVVFALNAVLIAAVFRMLSGVRASARALWSGALLGGVGLLVLQELSGLFVGGAKANPLLASFASLLALLLWLNLSTQVILVASSFIVISAQQERDRVAARHGARTLADFARQQAEEDVRTATAVLRAAQRADEHPR